MYLENIFDILTKVLYSLIALPFHGESVKDQNSVFLEPQSMEPYNDQWEFLEDIEKISYHRFKEIYDCKQ